jgi:hypothetical protein
MHTAGESMRAHHRTRPSRKEVEKDLESLYRNPESATKMRITLEPMTYDVTLEDGSEVKDASAKAEEQAR